MLTIETLIDPLRSVDWNETEAVDSATRKAFDQIASSRYLLRRGIAAVREDPRLMSLCEHYDILDKLVLFDDQETAIRVRLHIFGPGYHDRPHNHRWTYSSRILRGEYRHRIYSPVDLHTDLDPTTLHAMHVRQEQVGTSYTLHHSAIHAVVAEPGTVSIVLRGPAMADRFLVMDSATGQAWWQYGAAKETPDDAYRKRMTRERFDALVTSLTDWNVI
ncbi:hypothetical protein GV792_15840 [Nocardia cyriacigeorgica]|uniref:hypothetical protein n=1 Tax=Nocardia cyriacigeorgica TaxID=135487 RepID=UPI0013BAC6F7|nr:hypothetical protein [Nocardia cyriacigeorgica]NEW40161.1 hypothetical protein [Nocardia cyriacigeorgica]NEW51513.1 hypothetical protein [Nocardia cyriacigeorgica]